VSIYPIVGAEYDLTLELNVSVTLACGPRGFGYGQSRCEGFTDEVYQQLGLADTVCTKYAMHAWRYANGIGPGLAQSSPDYATSWITDTPDAGTEALGPFTPDATGLWKLVFYSHFGSLGYSWETIQDAAVVGATASDASEGRIIAMKPFPAPGVTHIVYQTATGQILARQNPY